jgi:hypothetical protein
MSKEIKIHKFENNDRVEIFNIPNDNFYFGKTGSVIGISSEFPEISFYIVLLDDITADGKWKAMSMIGSCLRKIYNEGIK